MAAELLLGRTDAGLVAGRTAYALLLREGDEMRTFWGFALGAAQNGALADAARIVGYTEAALARAGVVPDQTGIERRRVAVVQLERRPYT